MDLHNTRVLVVGAGIMGAGIAQVAAQAGHRVCLFDMAEGAAVRARDKLAATLQTLVDKGKLAPEAAQAAIARIEPVARLEEAADCGLVVEAIVEQLDAKRALFQQLEAIVGAPCVLASNTSSISITAIANGLQRPERLVGMHFFNPVPLMKLVEVVSGLRTAPDVAAAIFALSKAWGKVPVHAKSTPGFIVNRVARPYYAETLALLQEQAATPAVLDACLKAAGFRMGPCELMDLIGHDTNFAVTNSVFDANFQDKRYAPSLLQREMVAGGLLGRKGGQGFYTHAAGTASLPVLPVPSFGPPPLAQEVSVHGSGPIADQLFAGATHALQAQGWGPARQQGSDWVGLEIDGARLMLTDGRPATVVAQHIGNSELALFDRPMLLPSPPGTALAFCVHPQANAAWQSAAPAWLQALGFAPQRLHDSPGLVVARTLAMLINEAADAVLQGVCDPDGADAAMKLGVNYPAGPFEWLAQWSVPGVTVVLQALDSEYRGERYRVSPWLRRQPH
jgi:3-hydroxybutyryl-CoA dehydrogenase